MQRHLSNPKEIAMRRVTTAIIAIMIAGLAMVCQFVSPKASVFVNAATWGFMTGTATTMLYISKKRRIMNVRHYR